MAIGGPHPGFIWDGYDVPVFSVRMYVPFTDVTYQYPCLGGGVASIVPLLVNFVSCVRHITKYGFSLAILRHKPKLCQDLKKHLGEMRLKGRIAKWIMCASWGNISKMAEVFYTIKTRK